MKRSVWVVGLLAAALAARPCEAHRRVPLVGPIVIQNLGDRPVHVSIVAPTGSLLASGVFMPGQLAAFPGAFSSRARLTLDAGPLQTLASVASFAAGQWHLVLGHEHDPVPAAAPILVVPVGRPVHHGHAPRSRHSHGHH